MASYKALFVGEPKALRTRWKDRQDAARCIARDGQSVTHVYESEDGRRFFDVSRAIADILIGDGTSNLPGNVAKFINKHLP